MLRATIGSLIVFDALLAAACGSGDGDQPPDPNATPAPMTLSTSPAAIELDPAPGLPGEYVALPEIYQDERGLATYDSDARRRPALGRRLPA